ncbi:MAG: rod shape-determining protein MreC [Chloroflexi bacterium]|nr:rod shape-determining protein MreC [Chloroflexota bacterium]
MARLRLSTAQLFLLALAASVLILALDSSGLLRPVEGTILRTILPLQRALNQVGQDLSNLGQYLRDIDELRQEREELRALVDRLTIENVELREAQIENVELRQLLQFVESNPSLQLVAAEVVGRDPLPLSRSLLIDRGSEQGIASGMPVVTARGLVGRIVEVYPRVSRVLLLMDASSSVNARIQNSRATGVVEGTGANTLVMRFIQQAEPLAEGDIVLTSGLGGNFPRRLVIGQVTAVHQSDVELFQSAEVRPAVDFLRLELVLVVMKFEPREFPLPSEEATP